MGLVQARVAAAVAEGTFCAHNRVWRDVVLLIGDRSIQGLIM
jgi:hypothetical protein